MNTLIPQGHPEEVLRRRWKAAVLVLLGLVIMVFAVHRAATASFSHDESYSYIFYMKTSYWNLIKHVNGYTNNHLLNSMGMKLSQELFGNSELALRLPNLLALVLFLFYAARILLKLPAWFAICGFVLLGTNTFMLELFTLARGYGLSFGFMLMALFHLIRAIREARRRDIVLFHVASVLATLSNFTLLNVHLAGLITLYVLLVIRVYLGDLPRKRLVPITITNAVMLAISVAVLWLPIEHTLQQSPLDFGGKSDFFSTTVATWVKSLLPWVKIPDMLMMVLYGVIVLIVGAGLAVTIQRVRKGDAAFFTRWTALPTVLLVLVLTSIGGELQHALFGVDRMVDRFALFFVPLLVLLAVQLLALLHEQGWIRVPRAVMAIAALWGVFSFARGFGPYHSVEWQYDVRTKDAMATIARDMHDRNYQGPPLHIGINWLFEPTLNFYRIQMKLDRIQQLDRNGLTDDDAYRLVFGDIEGPMRDEGYVLMENYSDSGTMLFRRGDARLPKGGEE